MMTLALLLLAFPNDASAVLDRYEAFMAHAATLSVQAHATVNGKPYGGTGDVVIAKPNRVFYHLSGHGDVDYTYVLTESGAKELDRHGMMYDEYNRNIPKLGLVQSRISYALHFAFPRILIEDIKSGMPANAALTYVGTNSVGGKTVDIVEIKLPRPSGSDTITLSVDAEGRLLRYVEILRTQEEDVDLSYELSNYRVNFEPPAGQFTLTFPKGSVPYSTPEMAEPVPHDQHLDLGTWRRAADGASVNLDARIKGRAALIFVADPDCGPSKALLAAILQNRTTADVPLVVVSSSDVQAASATLPAKPVYYDPSGSRLAKLSVPGTPLLYLLDSHGNVAQQWFGYDPKQKGSMLQEISQAIKKVG